MNDIRVADIQACYIRDPDGYIIEVGRLKYR
jgi:hypothetical protein